MEKEKTYEDYRLEIYDKWEKSGLLNGLSHDLTENKFDLFKANENQTIDESKFKYLLIK